MFESWTRPEAVFQILKELSRGPALRHHGHRRLPDARRRRRHPVAIPRAGPTPAASERRLFEDGRSTTPTAGPVPLRAARGRCPSRPTPQFPAAAARRDGVRSPSGTRRRARAIGRPAQALPASRSTSKSIPTDARALGVRPERARARRIAAGKAPGQGGRHATRSSRARFSCPCITRK